MNQANIPGRVQPIMLGSAMADITVARKNAHVIKVIKKYLGLISVPPNINHIAKFDRRTLHGEPLVDNPGVRTGCRVLKSIGRSPACGCSPRLG